MTFAATLPQAVMMLNCQMSEDSHPQLSIRSKLHPIFYSLETDNLSTVVYPQLSRERPFI